MNILDEIVRHKRKELEERKNLYPLSSLKRSVYWEWESFSFTGHLCDPDKSGIIAEFKRKSPSKGDIHKDADIQEITPLYEKAGASAISVLTDTEYFAGTNRDIITARKHTTIPLLRKDFTIDEYHIIETKSVGAAAILLIAAVLSKEEIAAFTRTAHNLGLEVLCEIHNEQELDKVSPDVDMVGVNNRDLKTFKVDVNTSYNLLPKLTGSFKTVSESGISDVDTLVNLKTAGFDGFLIGEGFMKTDQPGQACIDFISRFEKALAQKEQS